jgi:hypothetical protein
MAGTKNEPTRVEHCAVPFANNRISRENLNGQHLSQEGLTIAKKRFFHFQLL